MNRELIDGKSDIKKERSIFRERFHIPKDRAGNEVIYFAGNSLGLQPKSVRDYIETELKDWEELGVEGHLKAKNPWMPYHEFLTAKTARLAGAKEYEVVNMNSLTVNLHLMMVSFYRPTEKRHKILIESNAFPSDRYAVMSQIRFHGYDVVESLLEVSPRGNESYIRKEDVLDFIKTNGEEISLILLGGVNYYTGQAFDFEQITKTGHEMGCVVGFDLAHAIGNLVLKLHDWDVDFAVWCSYKYLNAGPGAVGGAFVHERHLNDRTIPKFWGWWGHNKKTRFKMPDEFDPIPTAESWQLSNPPIFQLAALRASLDIFDEAGIENLRDTSIRLTGYLEQLINERNDNRIEIITPSDPEQRGCQLSLRVKTKGKELHKRLTDSGIICDWREPDVIRIAPVPLYNTFSEVERFAEILFL